MGTEILLVVLDSLDKYFMQIFGSFMASFGGFARAFVMLYCLLMGVGYFRAAFGEHTKEIGWSIVLVIVLQFFVMETAVYKEWFVNPIKRTTMQMASFFVNAGMGGGDGLEGLFTRLDDAFVKMKTTVDAIFPTGNLIMFASDYIKATLTLGAMTLAFGAVYAAYVITLCMGFFSMYVLFVVGGVCIFFGAFKQTRHITWSWCRAVANYALLVIFASMIMGICVDGISHAMDKLAANSDPSLGYFTREIGYVICWSLLSLGLLLKSADYAAALSGGMAGSTAMITGGLALTGGAMFSASKLAYNNRFTRKGAEVAGKWAGGHLSRAASAAKGIFRGRGPLDPGGN